MTNKPCGVFLWYWNNLIIFYALSSFLEIDQKIWKNAAFPMIRHLTNHNWVKFWLGVKKRTTKREYTSRDIFCFFFSLGFKALSSETRREASHLPLCAIEDDEMPSAGEV